MNNITANTYNSGLSLSDQITKEGYDRHNKATLYKIERMIARKLRQEITLDIAKGLIGKLVKSADTLHTTLKRIDWIIDTRLINMSSSNLMLASEVYEKDGALACLNYINSTTMERGEKGNREM